MEHIKQPPNIIIVFEKPDLYFFPHYSDIVFAPFGVPQPGFRYLVYKILYLFHLPCRSLFWGSWKQHIKTAGKVILFDYGYQRGMERYIRRVNPDCDVCLFFWNRVSRSNRRHLRFSDRERIYSTAPDDCSRYSLRYNHIFYPKEFFTPWRPFPQDRLFFLGADKGRAPYIASLKPVLEQSGLVCDIRIVSDMTSPEYRRQFQDILTSHRMDYQEYLQELTKCNVLLDISQKGQSALTMRVMEAIYLSKKLITGNQNVTDYDFYDPDNIYVLPKSGLPSPDEIRTFLEKPFRPYPETVLEQYSFENWIGGFD